LHTLRAAFIMAALDADKTRAAASSIAASSAPEPDVGTRSVHEGPCRLRPI
jgi:hypothetical protein